MIPRQGTASDERLKWALFAETYLWALPAVAAFVEAELKGEVPEKPPVTVQLSAQRSQLSQL